MSFRQPSGPSHKTCEGVTITSNLVWQRASACGGGGNNCVAVATSTTGLIAFRDSTRPERAVLTGRDSFRLLISGLKADGFTPPQV
ncbi:DUF397 domain-containing protein [Streptomyces scopuliridis]|uniref:DUF397 domain-containing protein n=1 Tax=Streptomyces scopuliridis TaxID=452529 RepID=UPI0036AE5B7F